MGASQEKKKRIAARENGTVKVNEKELEEQKKNKKFKTTAIVTIVVLILCVALILIIRSDFIYHNLTAVSVDGVNYSLADYNYFKKVKLNEYESYFGSIDGMSDLITDDIVENVTLNSLVSTTMYDKMAAEAGYELSESSQTKIDDAVATFKSYTNMSGMKLDDYIEAMFGTGVNEEVYRKNAARLTIAEEYRNVLNNKLEYSDEFLEENYNPDESDVIGFYLYTAHNSSQENEDTAAEDARALAEDFAAKVTDGESFQKLVAERSTGYNKIYYKYDPTACLIYSAVKSCNETYRDWLNDSSRKEGDCEVFTDDIASYVVYYVNRNDNRYHPVSIREIFFPHNVNYTDYETDEEYEEALKAALDSDHVSAEQIYNNWLEGEKTEKSFGQLANAYNTAGTTADGGLIEIVMKDVYNEAIDEWCFDPARQEGDTEIIDTPNGSYILYFIGEYPQTYRQYTVDSAVRAEDFRAWEEEELAKYSYDKGFIFRLAD